MKKIHTNVVTEQFLKLLATVGDEKWNLPVTDQWTIHDSVAHLVGWEMEAAKRLPGIWKTRRQPWFLKTERCDQFNKTSVAIFKKYPPKRLLREWKHWHQALDNEINKIGADRLKALPDLFSWVFDDGENNHYLHHLNQIKKTLRKYEKK